MSLAIYYFSGTGNTYYVARSIADASGGRFVAMAASEGEEEVTPEAECVGLAFPVHYGNLPGIVRRFTTKLRNLESRYVFAVATYGGGRGGSFGTLKALLRDGGRLSAGYGIHMPQNAFKKAAERQDSLFRKADAMVRTVCTDIDHRATGFHSTEPVADLLQRPLYPLLVPQYHRYLVRTAHGDKRESRWNLMERLDTTFEVGDSCTGCGTCAAVCPVNNIVLEDGVPAWRHHCTNCLACYAFCPTLAIRTELVTDGYHYRHPQYSLTKARAALGRPQD